MHITSVNGEKSFDNVKSIVMGKVFYASDQDKITAGRKANALARNYKKGVCWTPSREKDCTFDTTTGIWTCKAMAHHHEGSCGTWEIHRAGRGTEWQIGWTWDHDLGGNWNKSDSKTEIKPDVDDFENNEVRNLEDYSDALPEDYDDEGVEEDRK